MHKFTTKQLDWLRSNSYGAWNNELTEQFNIYFGTCLKPNQIKACKKNHKIPSGLTGYFKPGSVPYNKVRHSAGGPEHSRFKKGHMPHNWLPVGTELVNTNGYVVVKVAEPNKWKPKHILIWEAANGPKSKGHVLLFGDRNKLNVTLENLVLITRAQLAVMVRCELLSDNTEATKTGVIIADIKRAMRKRRVKNENRYAKG